MAKVFLNNFFVDNAGGRCKINEENFLNVGGIIGGKLKEFKTLYRNLIENVVNFSLGGKTMIKLTKFNSDSKKGEFILNAEHIQTIEETPDTVITLTNEKKLIVEEPMEEVVRRVMKYRRALNTH